MTSKKVTNQTASAPLPLPSTPSLRPTGEEIEQNFRRQLGQSNALVELLMNPAADAQISEIYESAKIISIDPQNVMIDERLNIRGDIDRHLVDDYARMMGDGDVFPPIDIVKPSKSAAPIVVDGRLRLDAARQAGVKKIKARLLNCDLDFAFAVKLRKSALYQQNWTTREKKPFVVALLKLAEDAVVYRRIARNFKIDHQTVSAWHREIKHGAVSYAGESPRKDSDAAGDFPRPPRDSARPAKGYQFPAEATEIHQHFHQVEFGECYRAQSPGGVSHYVFCADSTDRRLLAPFAGLDIFEMNCSDPPWGHDVPSGGRTYAAAAGNSFFGNAHLRGVRLEILVMNALVNLKECLKPGATYTIFTGYYERSMFERCCDEILGQHHNSLYWVKKNYTRSLNAVVSFGTEEALMGWTRGGSKPERTEGCDNVFQGCERRESGVYTAREFIEKSEYDVGGDHHSCSKPVFLLKAFIERFSRPGAVVIDNFAGSGSTGVACKLSGRQFVGIEMVPEFVAVILRRLEELGCVISKMDPSEPFLFPKVSVLGTEFFNRRSGA